MRSHTTEIVTSLLLPDWIDLRRVVRSKAGKDPINYIDIIDGDDYGRSEAAGRLRSAMQQNKLKYLVLSEIEMHGAVIEALVDLLGSAPGPWEAVYLEFCEGELDKTMDAVFALDNVKKLEIAGDIKSDCIHSISNCLKKCNSLKELSLLMTLDFHSAGILIDGLVSNTGLRGLKLTKSTLRRDSIAPLTEFFSNNEKLEALHLDRCIVSESDFTALLSSLTSLSTLKELSIGGMPYTEENELALLNLMNKDTLNTLCLQGLTPSGCRGLNEVLMTSAWNGKQSLRILDLSGNNLDDKNAELLVEYLCSNATLEEVRLHDNSITNTGACLLGQKLHAMKGLKRLFLHRNDFDEKGAKAILEGVRNNVRIQEVKIPAKGGSKKMARLQVLINYEACLNAGGKQVLQNRQFPLKLLPQVFKRAGKSLFSPYCAAQMQSMAKWKCVQQTDVIFYLLRHSDIGRMKNQTEKTK